MPPRRRAWPSVIACVTDGRDTAPHGGAEYVAALAAHAERAGTGGVATVLGRYLAMDRDHNWDRTARAAAALTEDAAGARAGEVAAGRTNRPPRRCIITGR